VNGLLVLSDDSFQKNGRDVDECLGEPRLVQIYFDSLVHQIKKFLEPFVLLVITLDSELVFFVEKISLIHMVIIA